MANQTVYPYGTGGSLPSSIGIINDLTTGGADKALSAEQGKVLGGKIGGGLQEILSANLTHADGSVGSNGNWGSGSHVTIPVTPGEEITVTAISMTTNGGYCAFVYDQSASIGKKIPSAPGSSIWWQGGTPSNLVVPTYAKYIVLTTTSLSYSTEYSFKRTLPDNYVSREGFEEIQDILVPIYEDVDLSGLTEVNLYPDSTVTPRKWKEGGSHIAVPVTPGDNIRVNILTNNGSGGWYFFVTNSYQSSLTTGKIIPLVGNLTWLFYPDVDGVVVSVPGDAAYICFCKNGNNNATWDLDKQKTSESGILTDKDIVNNLTTGGADKPLSAEQGKVLAGKISDGIPVGLTTHQYIGEPVKIGRTHLVACGAVSQITSILSQGGACFGDFLFMFRDNNTGWIYNLATSTLIQTFTIPEGELGFVSNCHYNTVNFGTEYYDDNDPFPLIYISTGYASDGYSGALAYRIVATTENDSTTFSFSLVQTIKIPGSGWTEFVTGDENDCYICYTSQRKIYRMKMPTLSQGDVTFDLSQAIDVYQFTPQPAWYNGSSGQGRVYYDGRIYFVAGEPSKSQTLLFVGLDLSSRRRVVEIDLQSTFGFTAEPEAVFIWNGHFCIVFRQTASVYALYFD